jgi:hypothetical protein
VPLACHSQRSPPGTSGQPRTSTKLPRGRGHRQLQAGIAGSAAEGAHSIVVSRGYEDDDDFGDLIIYTGQGGNDPATKRQVADQQPTLG